MRAQLVLQHKSFSGKFQLSNSQHLHKLNIGKQLQRNNFPDLENRYLTKHESKDTKLPKKNITLK